MLISALLILPACGNKETTDDTTTINTTTEAAENIIDDKTETPVVNLKEYQLKISIQADNNGEKQKIVMQIFQKNDKALYIMEDMPNISESPVQPLRSLLVGPDMYTQMRISGEDIRFKAEGEGMGLSMQDFFDLEQIQTDMEAEADNKKEEKINGKKMICYYKDGEEGKACTYKGIFAYWEATDPETGASTIMEVSDYDTNVNEDVFEIPTDAKDMAELATYMMQ